MRAVEETLARGGRTGSFGSDSTFLAGGTQVPFALSSSSLAHPRARSPRSLAISCVLETIIGFLAAFVLCSFANLARCQNVASTLSPGRKLGRMTLKYPIARNQYEFHGAGCLTVKYGRRLRAEYINTGISLLPPLIRAQATLQMAKSAADMDTPLALHFLRIALVRSSGYEIVGTIVRRSGCLRRGNACPPMSFC